MAHLCVARACAMAHIVFLGLLFDSLPSQQEKTKVIVYVVNR